MTRYQEEQKKLRDRFREKKLVMQIIALLYAVYLLAILGVGIWMAASPSDRFSLLIAGESLDRTALGVFHGFLKIHFAPKQLAQIALVHPKGVCLAQYAGLFLMRLPILIALWRAADIMEKVGAGDGAPCIREGSFRIAELLLLAACLRVWITPILIWIAGGGYNATFGGHLVFGGLLLAEAVIECLRSAAAYKNAQTDEADDSANG